MAATACAYAYQGAQPPPARTSPHVPEPPPFDLDDCAFKPASLVPPPPPPPRLLSSSSRHPGICTEGLGTESCGDVDLDDVINDVDNDVQNGQGRPCDEKPELRDSDDEPVRTKTRVRAFPPPISGIGAGGKPWLYLRPHREGGRLVLREVRIPSQELLHARREDGRFKLHFAQPQLEEEEEEQLVDVHYCQEQEQADASKGKRTTDGTEF